MKRFSENWDGIVRNRQDLLNEAVEYKVNDPRLVKAAQAALPPRHAANPQTVTKMAKVMWEMWAEGDGTVRIGELARLARVRLGLSEEAEPVTEDLSGGMFGEYRLERANNPRRQRQGRGNKGSEAQYCLRVHRGGSPFGWIIPLMGTEGKPIGYSFHYDQHPHDEGFKFYAFTWGSMKKTLDALKGKFLA